MVRKRRIEQRAKVKSRYEGSDGHTKNPGGKWDENNNECLWKLVSPAGRIKWFPCYGDSTGNYSRATLRRLDLRNRARDL